jgi:hypothetical protein
MLDAARGLLEQYAPALNKLSGDPEVRIPSCFFMILLLLS